MFLLFNLKLQENDKTKLEKYQNDKMYNDCETGIKNTIDKYLSMDGSLNAEAMEKDWFPDIDAQVFISHSSNDAKWARCLANLLDEKYQLKSFVDSMVWSHANNLLREIDDKYCVKHKNLTGGNIYNYEKRNQSTSHVHMILQGALAKMINKSLCLIFINTPNSISTKDVDDNIKTASPWIYNELLMANIFLPMKPRREILTESKKVEINHPVNLKNFADVTLEEIINIDERNPFMDVKNVREVLNAFEDLYNQKNKKQVIHG